MNWKRVDLLDMVELYAESEMKNTYFRQLIRAYRCRALWARVTPMLLIKF